MTTLAGKPLRLPGKRVTGWADPGTGGVGILAVTGEDYSWAGRPVANADKVGMPLFWTLEGAALTYGLTADEYRGVGLPVVDVGSGPLSPVRPPLAVVYDGGIVLAGILFESGQSSSYIRPALSGLSSQLQEKKVFCGGYNTLTLGTDRIGFDGGVPHDNFALASDPPIGEQYYRQISSFSPLCGKTLYVTVTTADDSGPMSALDAGSPATRSNGLAAAVAYLQASAQLGQQRWLCVLRDGGTVNSPTAISQVQSVAAQVPDCVLQQVGTGATDAEVQSIIAQEVSSFFGL